MSGEAKQAEIEALHFRVKLIPFVLFDIMRDHVRF